MPKTDVNATSLEYVYKEYVRLSERCGSYVQGSFDVCLAVIVFPIIILALAQKASSYALIYLAVSVTLLFIYGHAAKALLKE